MAKAKIVADVRKAPKQARSRALVESILDATARILVGEGFARTTTNRVAEIAGVSVGSLYQYFPSREALVAAVARRHSERLKQALEAELKGDQGSLKDSIRVLLKAIGRAHRVSPKLTTVLAGEVPKLGKLDWKAENTWRGVAMTQEILERHRKELRHDLDRSNAAFVCTTCVEGVMNAAARIAPEKIVSGAVVDELETLLLAYLLPQKARSRS